MSEKYNIEELIIRFLQQDINEEELRYLESWLEEDAEHKSYFFGLKGISDSSRRSFFSKEEVNEVSWQKMLARINKYQKKDPSFDKSRIRDLRFSCVKYAAIIIFAIGAGWGIHEFQGKIQQADLAPKDVVYNEIHVQKGGRANTVLLSDGSKVILNAATTFRYPTSFRWKNIQMYEKRTRWQSITVTKNYTYHENHGNIYFGGYSSSVCSNVRPGTSYFCCSRKRDIL